MPICPDRLAVIALVAVLSSSAASGALAQPTQGGQTASASAAPAGTGQSGSSPQDASTNNTEGLINRDSGGSASPSTPKKTTSIANSAARVAGSLAAVIGLIVLTSWAARRLLPRSSFGGAGSGGAVVVLAKTHLAPRQKILLVQIGRRVLVVGDGGGQLSTLCEIDDADEAAALIGQIHSGGQRDGNGGRSFASLFGAAKDRMRSPAAANPAATPALQTASANFDGSANVSPEEEEVESARRKLDGLMRQVRGLTRQIDRT